MASVFLEWMASLKMVCTGQYHPEVVEVFLDQNPVVGRRAILVLFLFPVFPVVGRRAILVLFLFPVFLEMVV